MRLSRWRHTPRLLGQLIRRFAHHAQALSGSAFDSTKDLPETAHSPCQVAMATVRRNHRTNTDEKNNPRDIISQLLYDFVKLGKAVGKNPDRVGFKKNAFFLQTDSLLPVLEVDDVGSLQARLQEIAQFYVLGGWARLWAAVLNTCRQSLQREKTGVKKNLNGRSKELFSFI